MGKIPSDTILLLQVEIMCSSIKYVLKVIIFSIFILVTGIEKGRLCFRKLPPGPWGLTFLLWSTRLRILTNEWASSVWKSLGSLSPGMWFEGVVLCHWPHLGSLLWKIPAGLPTLSPVCQEGAWLLLRKICLGLIGMSQCHILTFQKQCVESLFTYSGSHSGRPIRSPRFGSGTMAQLAKLLVASTNIPYGHQFIF